MIRTTILTSVAVLWAASAFAGCRDGMVDVLTCQISATQQLQVCSGGGKASYAYGPANAAELAMTQPLGQVQGTAWPGAGSAIWEEIIFTNNDVSYTVWIASSRNDLDAPPRGGVTVRQNGQELAALSCLTGTARISLFQVSDSFRDAGFCWDRVAEKYSRSCS